MSKHKSVIIGLVGIVIGVVVTYIVISADFVPFVMDQLHSVDIKSYIIIGLISMVLLIVVIAVGIFRWMVELLCAFGEVAGIGVGAWLKGNFGKRS